MYVYKGNYIGTYIHIQFLDLEEVVCICLYKHMNKIWEIEKNMKKKVPVHYYPRQC